MVIGDVKLSDTSGGTPHAFRWDVRSYANLYPYGMEHPGQSAGGGYRYGYNGMERDSGVAGETYRAYYREYDARLGRWWGIDPVTNAGTSPYVAMAGNPILASDASGADTTVMREGSRDISEDAPGGGPGRVARRHDNPVYTDERWVYDPGSGTYIGREAVSKPEMEEYEARASRSSFGLFYALRQPSRTWDGAWRTISSLPGNAWSALSRPFRSWESFGWGALDALRRPLTMGYDGVVMLEGIYEGLGTPEGAGTVLAGVGISVATWRVGGVVLSRAPATFGRGVVARASSEAIAPNKLHHIFGQAKHKLGPLLDQFGGSQEAAYRAVENATRTAARNQEFMGVFRTTVEVSGQVVVVKGIVIDGTAQIGSFWIP